MNFRSPLRLNPGKSRAVFLPEVPVGDYTLADVAVLRSRVYTLMADELTKLNAPWIMHQ
jgi:hypothetical protein